MQVRKDHFFQVSRCIEGLNEKQRAVIRGLVCLLYDSAYNRFPSLSFNTPDVGDLFWRNRRIIIDTCDVAGYDDKYDVWGTIPHIKDVKDYRDIWDELQAIVNQHNL